MGNTVTQGHTYTVLVVDDVTGIVEIYERWLADDFQVRTATDGQSALATLDESVDVVLIDRNLPKMSGSTVIEEIRNLGHDPGVVLLSSVEPDYDVIDVEFQSCLTKPVMRRELVDAIERAGSGHYPDRTNQAVSGPSLDDHATRKGGPQESVDGVTDPVEAKEPDEAVGPDRPQPEGEPAEADISERLQSLQETLDATATKLSRRAAQRSENAADGASVGPSNSGGTPTSGTTDTHETVANGDVSDQPTGSRVDNDHADETVSPQADGAPGGPGPPPSEKRGHVSEQESHAPGDQTETGKLGEEGPNATDRSERTRAGPGRADLADPDETDPDESLQQRVERLANQAMALAEGASEESLKTNQEFEAIDEAVGDDS